MTIKINGDTPVNANFGINACDTPSVWTEGQTSSPSISCWDYWTVYHYPDIMRSYPVYIQEKARDKGKQAFEILKILKDKKLINVTKVSDFIDVMDELIKIL